MFTDAFADFPMTTVQVSTKTGEGSKGPVYATPVAVTGFLQNARRIVRTAAGDEVTSETTLHADPDTAPLFTVGSLVDDGDRTAAVIKTVVGTLGDPDVDHVEAILDDQRGPAT